MLWDHICLRKCYQTYVRVAAVLLMYNMARAHRFPYANSANISMIFLKKEKQIIVIHSFFSISGSHSCYGNFGIHILKHVKKWPHAVAEDSCPGSVYCREVKCLDFWTLETLTPRDISFKPEILLWTSNSCKDGKNMLFPL